MTLWAVEKDIKEGLKELVKGLEVIYNEGSDKADLIFLFGKAVIFVAMKFKIHIGQYNNFGRFNCFQWKLLFEFFFASIDSINIYSFDENELSNMKMPIKYELLNPIDNFQCLYGFKILEIDQTILEYIRDYAYSIDWGIQFLYLYRKGNLISEFELEDSNNCVMLYLSSEEE